MKKHSLWGIVVLALAAVFLFRSVSSNRAEQVPEARTSPVPAYSSVEQQQAAVIYFKVISWLSQILPARAADTSPRVSVKKVSHTKSSSPKMPLCALARSWYKVRSILQP